MKIPKIRIPKELYRFGHSVKKNLPTILSIVGCIGVPVTAVLSSIATLKAKKILDNQPEDTSISEDIKAVAKHYIPAAVTGVVTMGSIVGANQINLHRNAALSAAGAALAAKFMAYKEQVKEIAGEEVDKEINRKKVKELLDNLPEVPVTQELTLYEPFTEQLIFTTEGKFKDAKEELNYCLQRDGSVTLNTFIKVLGGDLTELGDRIGWDENNEIQYSLWYEWQGFAWIDVGRYDDEINGVKVEVINYGLEPMSPGDYPLFPSDDEDTVPFDIR